MPIVHITPSKKLTDIDSADPLCANCDGEGWVCENHPECPWPDVCECGAGMPCSCNPLSSPQPE